MNNADMPAMPHDIVFGKGYPLNYDPTGLTKREHFAGLAMQGILADFSNKDIPRCAAKAVEFADALLKALEARDDL